ncbi:MAG TPA: preprotein translocase subunit YajC [Candidatus Brocadiia bacterium]|nr:preprotein translocase subunit YajC [Candidatus Brocadiia bacterium]
MNTLLFFAPFMVLMFAWIYFQGRGQKKKDKEREEMISAVRPGDRIVTIGGLHLKIVSTDKPDTVIALLDDNKDVKIKINRSAISKVVNSKDAPKDKDEKKAKE